MVRLVQNKGFTLLETLLVLFILSMLILIFPFIKPQQQILFKHQMYQLKACIQYTQLQAMNDKTLQTIHIKGQQVVNSQMNFKLINSISCEPANITFTANGTVTKAQSITCRCQQVERKLIIELGSGTVYVR